MPATKLSVVEVHGSQSQCPRGSDNAELARRYSQNGRPIRIEYRKDRSRAVQATYTVDVAPYVQQQFVDLSFWVNDGVSHDVLNPARIPL